MEITSTNLMNATNFQSRRMTKGSACRFAKSYHHHHHHNNNGKVYYSQSGANRINTVKKGALVGNAVLLGAGLLSGCPLITFAGVGVGLAGYFYADKIADFLKSKNILK